MPTELSNYEQQPIRLSYLALMPDGSTETVVDGQVIYRSEPDPALVELMLDVRRRWPAGEHKP